LLLKEMSKYNYMVSISGTGADEMFSGYYDHYLMYMYDVKENKPVYDDFVQAWERHVKPLVRNPFLQDPDAFIRNPLMREHLYMDANEISSMLCKEWSEAFHEEQYTSELLRNRMMNEMHHEIVPPILHEDDLNAMRYSIENRSPFLDRSLYEFCCSIPTKLLMQNGFNKIILRNAMRGITPDSILDNRRKVGFNAPILSLFDPCDKVNINWIFNDSPIYEFLCPDKVHSLLRKPQLTNNESKFLFSFINAKIFLEEFS